MRTRDVASDARPHRLLTLRRSTIGKKYVAAVSGLILAIFVVLHMLGNLKALEGAGGGHPAIDRYAHFLRTVGSPVLPHNFALWIERVVLILAVVAHVTAITHLWLRNRAAKPGRTRTRSWLSDGGRRRAAHAVLGLPLVHRPRARP